MQMVYGPLFRWFRFTYDTQVLFQRPLGTLQAKVSLYVTNVIPSPRHMIGSRYPRRLGNAAVEACRANLGVALFGVEVRLVLGKTQMVTLDESHWLTLDVATAGQLRDGG